jgi:hypothetical protein
MAAATVGPANTGTIFIPREHGAIAMLLTPFFAAAILLRQVYWPELVALLAVACAFAIKDPLVVVARQRFVWKQEHTETKSAKRWAMVQSLPLLGCGITLMLVRDWRPFIPLFLGAGAFTVLAVILNVRNRQRSEWFQVASAVALSATSLAACLSAKGFIPGWCWLLWLLCSLQAAAGIFVVHARLDARVAARKRQAADNLNRRAAVLSQVVLILAAVVFALLARFWIAAALLLAAICYLADLKRQKDPQSLQIPLKRIGLQALALSIAYALVIIAGLWRG